jgi:hypothetical protein
VTAAGARLDALGRLQRHLAAFAALPKSVAAQIPALDDYIRATSTITQERALERMFAYLDQAHLRRVEELPTAGNSDTSARQEIRENEPLVALLALLTSEVAAANAFGLQLLPVPE